MNLRELAKRIEAFRDLAARSDPHGAAHQCADLYLREARELAQVADAERDPVRLNHLRAWVAANSIN